MRQVEAGQSVLFVDDEENVLRALKRLCRKEPYEVLTASSGEEALSVLEATAVDLIVSDLRMPGMDGAALLAEVAERFPDVPRILLSGTSDLPAVINAVNEGRLSYYLEKPWDDDALRLLLREYLKRRALEREQDQLNRQLAAQAETIAKEAELKARFLAIMSHEIRTPLNGLTGVLQMMADPSTDPDDRDRLLQTSVAAASDLSVIVNDVLDFSKLESGEMTLEAIELLPGELVESVMDLMRPMAVERELGFSVTSGFEEGERIVGDPVRLRQVVTNLISNAIKYTNEGEVSMEIVPAGTDHFVIRVSDTGIGIPADKFDQLFSEFRMLDVSHARKHGGTGLGLTITRRLVELMQGAISIESEVGKGSTFTVRLPLRLVRPKDQLAPVEAEAEEVDLSGRTYLVVDDNESNRLVINAMLQKRGARVMLFDGGLSLVHYLQREPEVYPDAVLLDINMPDLDGFETLRLVRGRRLLDAGIPVFALTANVLPEQVESYDSAGFSGLVAKPVVIADLLRALSEAVDRPALPADETMAGADYELSRFEALMKETGEAMIPVLVEAYLRECDKRVANLGSDPDSETLAREAHAIANSAAMYGAVGLYQVCREVEAEAREGTVAPQLAQRLVDLITDSRRQVKAWSERPSQTP